MLLKTIHNLIKFTGKSSKNFEKKKCDHKSNVHFSVLGSKY